MGNMDSNPIKSKMKRRHVEHTGRWERIVTFVSSKPSMVRPAVEVAIAHTPTSRVSYTPGVLDPDDEFKPWLHIPDTQLQEFAHLMLEAGERVQKAFSKDSYREFQGEVIPVDV